MDTKKPWQSRTLVLNAIFGIIAAVALFVPGAGSVQTWLTTNASQVALGWSVLNMVLRTITKDKIQLGD